jgi:hypothetical protein
MAPTAIAVEIHAGADTPVDLLSFPAAITIDIPTPASRSTRGFRGSESQEPVWREPSPRLRFTDESPGKVALLL